MAGGLSTRLGFAGPVRFNGSSDLYCFNASNECVGFEIKSMLVFHWILGDNPETHRSGEDRALLLSRVILLVGSRGS